MVHSPSWEANWFAASQEIPRISRNPKVHYLLTHLLNYLFTYLLTYLLHGTESFLSS